MRIERRGQYNGGEFDIIMSHHVIKKHYRVLMRNRESHRSHVAGSEGRATVTGGCVEMRPE